MCNLDDEGFVKIKLIYPPPKKLNLHIKTMIYYELSILDNRTGLDLKRG